MRHAREPVLTDLIINGKKFHIDTSKLRELSFEVGPFRPPSEGASQSLLLRFMRNCSWNKCTFCSMYKDEKFTLRSVEEIKQDIDNAKAMVGEMKEISHSLGRGGVVDEYTVYVILGSDASLERDASFTNVAMWLLSGGRTAFLQDSNSLIIRPDDLVEALEHLRSTFPSLKRVTSYCRSDTIARKKLEDLKRIREAGLDRLHVGLETGDDELLERLKKLAKRREGRTSDYHIIGGRKAKEAGFQLSEYFMPGLGGKERWEQHALNTARVVNAIDPDYVRSRPLGLGGKTELDEEWRRGDFELTSFHERLVELQTMVEALDFTGRLVFDHMGNAWRNASGLPLFTLDHEGYKFPDEKTTVLELIDEGLSLDESFHGREIPMRRL
ncbi:MAG: radical SAM protein [Candidatus Hydrogenedentes bacterium]|nr:radical SAM protein [Candidatus Hydrogenedentota bacterium]